MTLLCTVDILNKRGTIQKAGCLANMEYAT